MALLATRRRVQSRRARVARLAWVMVSVLISVAGVAATASQSEQDVKAAYLYNFTRFVTWPPGTPAEREPFRVCVVADGATTRVIQRTMRGESVSGNPVVTLVPENPAEARLCQMLFVGRAAGERGRAMVEAVRELPVLTVGESPGFVRHGGSIEFVIDQSKVRFDINPIPAERAGLSISSRLLSVARNAEAVKR